MDSLIQILGGRELGRGQINFFFFISIFNEFPSIMDHSNRNQIRYKLMEFVFNIDVFKGVIIIYFFSQFLMEFLQSCIIRNEFKLLQTNEEFL